VQHMQTAQADVCQIADGRCQHIQTPAGMRLAFASKLRG
jgi:hypothetical protein